MFLNFYLEGEETEEQCTCTCCDNVHMRKYTPNLFHGNITHNLGRMAAAAGIYECLWRPDENGLKKAKNIILILEKGLDKLIQNPHEFKKFNSSDGWGTIEALIRFTSKVLETCKQYPESNIKIRKANEKPDAM